MSNPPTPEDDNSIRVSVVFDEGSHTLDLLRWTREVCRADGKLENIEPEQELSFALWAAACAGFMAMRMAAESDQSAPVH